MRTPGFHASDWYGSYYRALDPKRFDKRDIKGEPLPFDLLKLEFGLTFEQEFEETLSRQIEAMRRRMAVRLFGERPPEFTAPHDRDCPIAHHPIVTGVPCLECGAGTIFSPDYLLTEDVKAIMLELKLTWYSDSEAPTGPKFAKYWTQQSMYLNWLGLQDTRLIGFFVNGNYKPPTPTLRAWNAHFTDQELRDDFKAHLKFAKKGQLFEQWQTHNG